LTRDFYICRNILDSHRDIRVGLDRNDVDI
jgi:hypothetical protein